MNYSRIMAIDYGEVRIGIAFSDLLRIIASPYETYVRKNETADLNYLAELIKKQTVSEVVFGLPLNMDGTEGERALKTREFAQKLSDLTCLDIAFCDERLSSVTADEMLINAGVRREDRKKKIDKLAATIILDSYMKSKK